MGKLRHPTRVISGIRFDKLNRVLEKIKEKSGQSKVYTFFDILVCAAKYGAGYYDYLMFGFYDMNGRQRDTYLTRVRNKKIMDLMNDPAFSDEFDDKLRFNKTFAAYLGRKTLNGETATEGGAGGIPPGSGGHLRQDQPRRLRTGRGKAVCEGF